jgi:hypothetical protein
MFKTVKERHKAGGRKNRTSAWVKKNTLPIHLGCKLPNYVNVVYAGGFPSEIKYLIA